MVLCSVASLIAFWWIWDDLDRAPTLVEATSFTLTPWHAGNLSLGYRDSARYGGGITLGNAMTISGAAASPKMGYNSSPLSVAR